jgi:predicted 3-demethylubiquinone-9 3-methyltransferase (glyoxalase superfamily)
VFPLLEVSSSLPCEGQRGQRASADASIFDDSKIRKITRYGEAGPGPEGSVMTEFELDGQSFVALNGGPQFKDIGGLKQAYDGR